MSNVAIFKAGKTPEYLVSVNTPDYDKDPDVLVNPDVSALKDVPLKYWKRQGSVVTEMTQPEKLAVDNAEKAERDARTDNLDEVDSARLAKALVSLGVITKAQLVAALKAQNDGIR